MDNFIVTLVSNNKGFEKNEINDFTTVLPQPIRLDSSWQVALTEVHYPKSFYSIDSGGAYILVGTDDIDVRNRFQGRIVYDLRNKPDTRKRRSKFKPAEDHEADALHQSRVSGTPATTTVTQEPIVRPPPLVRPTTSTLITPKLIQQPVVTPPPPQPEVTTTVPPAVELSTVVDTSESLNNTQRIAQLEADLKQKTDEYDTIKASHDNYAQLLAAMPAANAFDDERRRLQRQVSELQASLRKIENDKATLKEKEDRLNERKIELKRMTDAAMERERDAEKAERDFNFRKDKALIRQQEFEQKSHQLKSTERELEKERQSIASQQANLLTQTNALVADRLEVQQREQSASQKEQVLAELDIRQQTIDQQQILLEAREKLNKDAEDALRVQTDQFIREKGEHDARVREHQSNVARHIEEVTRKQNEHDELKLKLDADKAQVDADKIILENHKDQLKLDRAALDLRRIAIEQDANKQSELKEIEEQIREISRQQEELNLQKWVHAESQKDLQKQFDDLEKAQYENEIKAKALERSNNELIELHAQLGVKQQEFDAMQAEFEIIQNESHNFQLRHKNEIDQKLADLQRRERELRSLEERIRKINDGVDGMMTALTRLRDMEKRMKTRTNFTTTGVKKLVDFETVSLNNIDEKGLYKYMFAVRVMDSNGEALEFEGGDFQNVGELAEALNTHFAHDTSLFKNHPISFLNSRDHLQITPRYPYFDSHLRMFTFPFFLEDLRMSIGMPTYDSTEMVDFYKSWKSGRHSTPSFGPVDLKGGYANMFIYSDIVRPHIVADTRASVLRTVGIPRANFGENISNEFQRLDFFDLSLHEFDTIRVTFNFDDGKPVPFKFGRTIVQLLFQRK